MRLGNRVLPGGRLVALILLAAVLLSACGNTSPATTVPTRTPKPTFTAVAVATNTPLPVFSATPVATATSVPSPTSTATSVPTPSPTPNPYLNPITGEMVEDPTVLQRRPLLVRIGNDVEIRPQIGLAQADMVYEEAMEGGWITRFTAVVWSQDPEVLWPIRSARMFTMDLGYMFDGALVHSGANDQVRWLISQSTLTDLDELWHGVYSKVTPKATDKWSEMSWMGSTKTSAVEIRAYLARKGKDKAVQLRGFVFSGEGEAPPGGEPATYVRIPYPSRALVEFRYDAAGQVYKRFVRGEPHNDGATGQQLSAANVIVHYSKYEGTGVFDKNGEETFEIISVGEGRAQIFRDGVMIEAKWVRPQMSDFCQYVYLDGTPVPLRPGQTWVEVVPTDYQVTYKVE